MIGHLPGLLEALGLDYPSTTKQRTKKGEKQGKGKKFFMANELTLMAKVNISFYVIF